MKGLGSTVTKAICVGTQLVCNDNSGAKIVEVIGVDGYRAKRGMIPKAGVSEVVTCAVKKGTQAMKKKVVKAVIVRQRKEFRRPNGTRISFEDNAAVLVDDQGLPVGTEIKGAVAREVADRFPKVAAIAAAVV
jgi:large subunit ribosomal protein L14